MRRFTVGVAFTGALCLSLASLPAPAAVGRTAGQAGVTPDGQATYSIPLVLPPGTSGLTPSLSLEYRHNSYGGLVGIGWAVGGLSQISRCARTIAQDGAAGPVTLDSTSRYCLDGQRLVVSNGAAYGSTQAEYRTEIESFARVKPYGTSGFGPLYLIVEGRDGLIREYGATADSRIEGNYQAYGTFSVRVWALNRIKDRSGNVIDFAYTEDATNKSYRIASVSYNSNPGAGISASHVVSFVYESRPSNEVDLAHVQGTPVRQIVRLDRIDVKYNGAIVRRYDLTYEGTLSTGGRSRLASIVECGVGGTDCLAPTFLTWQNGSPGLGTEMQTGVSLPLYGSVFTPDINGDGRSDLAWADGPSGARTIRYRLALASGGFGTEINTGISGGPWATLDQNGDGFEDILSSSSTQWQLIRGSASGLGSLVNTGITMGNIIDVRGADMNGDGLDDLAYSELDGGANPFLVVRVRYAIPGGTFSATPATLYEQYQEWPGNILGGAFLGAMNQRIDLDGDGREDLLLNEDYTIARISATESAVDYFDSSFYGGTPADINGDGCTDFVYPHYTGYWRVRFSSCQVTWWTPPELIGPASTGLQYLAATMDWNGDGKDDVVYRTTSSTWRVAISTGDALLPVADTGVTHGGAYGLLALDNSGDGLQDILTIVNNQVRYRIHTGLKPDLLVSATDGFGVLASFSYSPITIDSVYTKSSGATYPDRDVQDGQHVVSQMTLTDGTGTGTTTSFSYSYEGLRYSGTGRGSLGFAKKTTTDNTLGYGTRTTETYRQDFPFIGQASQIVIKQSTGTTVREITDNWSALTYGYGYETRQFPYILSSTDKHYEVGGTYNGTHHTTVGNSVAAIDSTSGLVTDLTTTVSEVATGLNSGSSRSERVLHSSLLNDTTNWCLGRPQTTQVTASHTLSGGTPITRIVGQTWDGLKCRPTQQQLEPGNGQLQVTVGLVYDSFGNVSSQTVTGIGMAARTTTLSWDARGQFPLTVTNPLSQSATQTWRYDLGLPTSVTDPNGLTTSWTYDGFGRRTLEIRPDLTRTTWDRASCSGGCDSRTRYQVSRYDKDTASSTIRTTIGDVNQFDRMFKTATQMAGGGYSVAVVDADARGRPVRQYVPYWSGSAHNGYAQVTYDAADRIVSEALYTATAVLDRQMTNTYLGLVTTATDPRGYTQAQTRSAWGSVVRMTDQGGSNTTYQYNGLGQLTQVTDALGNIVSSVGYNARGFKTSQTDLDMGAWFYTPNAFGEVVSQTDAKAQSSTFVYDLLGRMTGRTEPAGTSSWVWGTSAASKNIGQLASVSGPGYSESWTYDSYARPSTRSITTDTTYQYSFAYNSLGRLDSLTYPTSTSGYRLKLGYEYTYGYASKIKDFNAPATVLWQLNTTDAAGNVLDENLGVTIKVVTGFSPLTGLMEYRQTGVGGGAGIQNLAYQWDTNGNLKQRRDLNQSLTEDFYYDGLNRLDDSFLNGSENLRLAYDAIGNITSKTSQTNPAENVGSYTYHATRKHAVTAAGSYSFAYDANGNVTTRSNASLTWYSYNLPNTINQTGGNYSQFSYGPDRNRWKQVANYAGTIETTIYVGGLMEKVTKGSATTYKHYVQAPTGVAALYLRRSGGTPAEETYYLTHDHLGSTDRVINAAGTVIAVAESFEAYGRRRNGSGWTGAPSAPDLTAIGNTTRDGFTSHEQLDNLNLIHMNGRVFDPVVGRFMSADPYIQAPFNSQSLNRYAYVWNNPGSLVDPTGFLSVPACDVIDGCGPPPPFGPNPVAPRGPRSSPVLGGGSGQVASAALRDPCGWDGSALACVMQGRTGIVQASPVVNVAVGPAAGVDGITGPPDHTAFSAAIDRIWTFIEANPGAVVPLPIADFDAIRRTEILVIQWQQLKRGDYHNLSGVEFRQMLQGGTGDSVFIGLSGVRFAIEGRPGVHRGEDINYYYQGFLTAASGRSWILMHVYIEAYNLRQLWRRRSSHDVRQIPFAKAWARDGYDYYNAVVGE